MKQIILQGENGLAAASVEDLVSSRLNFFRGWHCEAGLENLYIDFDGRVWVANCAGSRAYQWDDIEKAWGYLGNIDTKFQLPTSNVICPYASCGCGSDIVTTKYRGDKPIQFFDKNYQQATVDLAQLKNMSALKTNYPMHKQILWDVGRFCNYNCSYCWPAIHNMTDPHKSLEVFCRTADYLIDNWAMGGQIRWYFGGGEPTLNPNFESFVAHLAARNQWIMLVSNGSRSSNYWATNADHYDTLIFSVHFEFVKDSLFFKNFKQVADILENNPKRLNRFVVKLMTKPGEIEKSKFFVEKLKQESNYHALGPWARERITFDMVPLRGLADGSRLRQDYTQDELNEIVKFNSQPQ